MFGSAIDYPDTHVFHDEKVAALYVEQCGIFTSGFQPLWSQNQPTRDTPFDFFRMDRLVKFAKDHNRRIAGHPLIWHQFVPHWVKLAFEAGDGQAVMEHHIQALMDRYRGQMEYWVVVNEPFDWEKRRADGMIPGPFAEAFGEAYVDIAFAAAAEVDPTAKLVLNEVGTEDNYPTGKRKRAKIIKTIQRLQDKNIRIDAIGVLGHLRPDFPFSRSAYRSFLNKIKSLGLEVIITELDVEDSALPGDFARRDAAVGKTMRDFINLCVGTRACTTVLTWGLINGHSWLNKPVAGMDKWDLRNPRKDGLPHRPLLYDDDLQPTAAREAVAKALTWTF